MKSINKISGVLVAAVLTVTVVSMGLMESADARSQRAEGNQQARQDCDNRGAVIGACVGGVNANVQAQIACSVSVLSQGPLCD